MRKDENYKAEMRRRKHDRDERTPSFTIVQVDKAAREIKHIRLERKALTPWEDAHRVTGYGSEDGKTEVVEDAHNDGPNNEIRE